MFCRLIGLTLCLGFAGGGVRAAPTWQRVEGPGFVLLSPDKSAEALASAREFSDFVAMLGTIIHVDAARLPPLTLVSMKQGRAFRPYRPLNAAGKPQDVAGFFGRNAGWSVAVLTEQADAGASRRLLQHEGVHWYLSGLEIERPMWVEEGLAEVFATFGHRGGVPALGEPIPEHIRLVRDTGILPVERLVTVTRRDPLYDESARAGRFYASAWLLTHYLLFGQHQIPRNAFDTYLNQLRANPARSEVFRAAFGLDHAEMDKALAAYLRRGRFAYYAVPLQDAVPLHAAPAAALEVEAALAKVALTADRYEQAEKHLALVRELAPEASPLPHEIAGHLAAARKDQPALEEAFARAAALGSRDVGVFYWPATFARRAAYPEEKTIVSGVWDGDGTLTQGELRRVANLYKRAINLQPRWRPAYEGLAGVLPALQTIQAADRPFIEKGLVIFPDSLELHYTLGFLDLYSENSDSAIARLEAVIRRAGELGEVEIATKSRRAVEDARFFAAATAIRHAAESGDLATARRLFAELREAGVPMDRRHELINIDRNLVRLEEGSRAEAP